MTFRPSRAPELGTTAPVLSRELFAVFAGFVEERVGLHHRPTDMLLFGEKLRARATEAGFDSLLDYYYFLRYDPASTQEQTALLEALFVHETYFFREPGPLGVGIDRIIAPRIGRGPRPRIWSAACSTGEEPYTLAMMLDERGLLGQVDIVATDVSARALDKARGGLYGGRALRVLTDGPRARWFHERGEQVEVDERLRRQVDWREVNLLDRVAVAALGSFDLIFCRNVLIYFSDETIARVVERIAGTMRADAVLAVGASESLLRFGTLLDCEELGGAFFYRRSTRGR